MLTEQLQILKVYELEPKQKHPVIFEWFDKLQPSEAFIIENDHDPLPLYYQLKAERNDKLAGFEYLKKGPEIWIVQISKTGEAAPPPDSCSINQKELTIGEIVAKDIRNADVMKKLGIDFCCGGKKTKLQAATEAGITVDVLEKALQEAELTGSNNTHNFNGWDADFLADYIYNQHHNYFYENRDSILQLADKVQKRHGKSHPELIKLAELVGKLFGELKIHFYKEENIIFPYIKELVTYKKEGTRPASRINMTQGPLAMMHMEHEIAGDMLKTIRNLTNDYQVPDGACNSFQLLYHKLKELENDLHQHIHLENNILFPKALQLEKSLVN
jgi:regulator of cell morphogenesis and NO signaling